MALDFLGAPPNFDYLLEFQSHFVEDYGGFCHDLMHHFQIFKRKKNTTSHTMYPRLVRFSRQSKGVFTESQLVKMFLSKIIKFFINLAMPMIIMHDDKQMRYSNTIAVVEQCGCALCEQVPTNLVLLLMDSSKSRKASVAAVRLAKTNMDKI